MIEDTCMFHVTIYSLDRYIAVTHPITYPNIMTSKRAKLLILGAWILSFVVCFPPLVGWNDRSAAATSKDQPPERDLNSTQNITQTIPSDSPFHSDTNNAYYQVIFQLAGGFDLYDL